MIANISPLLTHRIPPAASVAKYYWSESKRAFYQSNVHDLDIPSDCVEITEEKKEYMLQSIYSGKLVSMNTATKEVTVSDGAPSSRDSLLSVFNKPTEAYLDNFAAEKGYRSIEAACSYISSTNLTYKSEAEQAILARDLVWDDYAAKIATYKADASLPLPTVQDFIASLPVLTWAA